jgi:hypothetical protein
MMLHTDPGSKLRAGIFFDLNMRGSRPFSSPTTDARHGMAYEEKLGRLGASRPKAHG